MLTLNTGVPNMPAKPGENHHRAILSDKDVEAIREWHQDGEKQCVIALAYDASAPTICRIVNHKRRTKGGLNADL